MLRLKGNARGCLIYEPMFILPYSLFVTYATVYMLELGVTERQIGLITSLGLVLQIGTSLISGHLTDRLGRRKALLLYDLFSWSLATLLWLVADNVWFFVAAAVINSFQKVPHTAWICLLVEDTQPKERATVFTVLQFISVVSGLFAPLGGLLVSHYTLVPAVRIMYGMAFISMTLMFIGRHFATHETEIGVRIRQEKKALQWSLLMKDSWSAVRQIVSNQPLLWMLGVYILYQFQLTMSSTYLSIYLIRYLSFGESFIAWFPAVTSAATLLLMVFVIPRLNPNRSGAFMLTGLLACLAANTLIIFAVPGNVFHIVLSTMLAAAGSILVYPYMEAAVQNAIEGEQRAHLFSIVSVLILACISPAGLIGGWAYSVDPRLPFVLIAAAFVASTALLLVSLRMERKRQRLEAGTPA